VIVEACVVSSGLARADGGGAASWRVEVVASLSLCGRETVPGAYQWPVQPFNEQHPVRGNFGDPRIISGGKTVGSGFADAVVYQFHNGVDIAAADGSRVYPVLDGVVRRVAFDFVVVGSGPRAFQYWHLQPMVRVGERVSEGQTVLGTILPRLGHVHLTEIDGTKAVNPLGPGHLYPYFDSTPPVVDNVTLLANGTGEIPPTHVHGVIEIIAQAHDQSSVPVSGLWRDMPVTPATINWTLFGLDGRADASGAGVDFRESLPRPRDFWSVYAQGTDQNFPVVGGRHLVGTAGRYVFRLGEIDTRALAPGPYQLRVQATDVCGNSGTLVLPIQIVHDQRAT
jgi:hypothetical protein